MSRTAIASLAIMTFPALEPVYQDFAIVDLSVPYVPGFLAFREVPALLPLFERLRATRPDLWPQLLLADGNGFFHPRRSGIASHLGVILDLPTVGVAKELFILDGLARAPFKRASRLAFGAPLAEAAAEDGAVTAALAAVSGASTEAVEAGWRALYPQLSGSDSSSGGGSGHASEATAFQDAAAAVAAAAAAVAAAVSVSAVPVVGASGTLWAAALIPIPGARSPLAQAPAPAATAATAAAAAAAPGDAAAPAPLQPPNPVFVSVGHRVSLRTAVAVVAAVSPLRVPEPLRAADLGSREVVRRWVAARVAKASAKAAAGATTGARADAAAQPAREHQGCEPSDDRGNADSGDGIV
jgi:deoxyinosine 3'endonuclease (endonuclease V)